MVIKFVERILNFTLITLTTCFVSCDTTKSDLLNAAPTLGNGYETIISDLNHPWGLAFLSEEEILITERNGDLKFLKSAKLKTIELDLEVNSKGQGGLLDIKLSPNYEKDEYIYLTYSKRIGENLSTTSLVRFRLKEEKVVDMEEIFEALPYVASSYHYGSRIAFDNKENIYITVGDRFNYTTASEIGDPHLSDPQKLNNHLGKIIRLKLDGSIPEDNPFLAEKNAYPEVFTFGHRNPQGIAYSLATNQLFIADHGPQGGDEVNELFAGRNYGWPVITYGKDYNDQKVGLGTAQNGMEQPLHYWDPSVAPSSLLIYSGNKYGAEDGELFVTSLKNKTLFKVSLVEKKITVNEFYKNEFGRIRNIEISPGGVLYLITDDNNGSIIKLLN